MTGFTLSVNSNPLVNRIAGPTSLIETVANEIMCGHLQLTPEFLNPSWNAPILRRMVREFNRATIENSVQVTSIMTSTYLRLNHFGHPDSDLRRYYVDWFKTLVELACDVGASSIGSQFAILTSADQSDPTRHRDMTKFAIDCWHEVSDQAKIAGLQYLFWEPMSVEREFGHTITSCKALQDRLSQENFSVPMKMIVDVDHGDVTSKNPADADPYAWAQAFPKQSPILHVKQSSNNKGGHWPFTAEHNASGRIDPEKLLSAVKAGGGTDNEICLELSFREREPSDSHAVAMMAESVAHWAPHTNTGKN